MAPRIAQIFKSQPVRQLLRANERALREARASGDPEKVHAALEKSVAGLTSTLESVLGVMDDLIDEVDRRAIAKGREQG